MGCESTPKPICIVGTTASGKTELSLKLAESFIKEHKKVVLISLDAFQIYKGMDIGTGKIDLKKYSHIPHLVLTSFHQIVIIL
jgi:tRNA dimethylallyltransferase